MTEGKIDQPTRMRDGSVASDPRLGRLAQFDEKSRRYNVADVRKSTALTSKSWTNATYLDQGSTSACTGHSRTYDIAGYPKPVAGLTNNFANRVYELAKTMDEWPGEAYEGSSVLGALKAATSLGYIGEYRWAFNIDDMLAAMVHLGPVVVGTIWYDSMFYPRPSGLLVVDNKSGEAGGHAYYFRRILVSRASKRDFLGTRETIRDEPLLIVRNSWGQSWAKNGEAAMWASDYQNNLWPEGEQSVVTKALVKS
jgi:hypothetical protein